MRQLGDLIVRIAEIAGCEELLPSILSIIVV